MDELIQQLTAKVGLTQAQAQQVMQLVGGFLKDKLPADVLNQVTGALGGLGDMAGDVTGAAQNAAGQAAGAAPNAAGQAAGAASGAASSAGTAASTATDQASDAAGGIMSKISGMFGSDKD
jgi:hypothetical protein